MKKRIAALISSLALCAALAVSAGAVNYISTSGDTLSGSYYSICVETGGYAQTAGDIEIENSGRLDLRGTLMFYQGLKLTGSNVYFSTGSQGKISVHRDIDPKAIYVNITFADEASAGTFAGLLNKAGINSERDGRRVVAGCEHSSKTTTSVVSYITETCDNCKMNWTREVTGEQAVSYESSVLSEGSLTIVVGVACLAVGFLAAMFIFRKKKA